MWNSLSRLSSKRNINDFKVFRKRVDTFYLDVDKGKIKTTEF